MLRQSLQQKADRWGCVALDFDRTSFGSAVLGCRRFGYQARLGRYDKNSITRLLRQIILPGISVILNKLNLAAFTTWWRPPSPCSTFFLFPTPSPTTLFTALGHSLFDSLKQVPYTLEWPLGNMIRYKFARCKVGMDPPLQNQLIIVVASRQNDPGLGRS